MRLPALLSPRKADTNKSDYGRVLILAGSAELSGAGALASLACLRCGAGLVTWGLPQGLNKAVIKIKPWEAMTLPLAENKDGSLSLAGYKKIKDFLAKVDVLAIGPGLGQNKSTIALIRKVIISVNKSVVIDADGLNALVGKTRLLRSKGQGIKVITPHPGEMARLLGVSVAKVQADREGMARKFACDYKVVVVLKGHRSVVCDGKRCYINKTGNPGMATAGSGDVLTGMITGFLAQGLDAFSAAKYGVYLHGLAGDLAAEEKTEISLIAGDIIAKIPAAVKRCL